VVAHVVEVEGVSVARLRRLSTSRAIPRAAATVTASLIKSVGSTVRTAEVTIAWAVR
jgi:hypothetical protein